MGGNHLYDGATILGSKRTILGMEKNSSEPDRRKPVILFADDDPLCLDVGIRMLRRLGYHVLDAKDGKEAISVFVKNQSEVDLVILDMKMPHNGATTFYEMKQIDSKIKVLIASGYSDDYRIRQILSEGCKGFLQKPFTLNTLSQKIRHTLNN
jgi:CheY-like chemotaxis protein